MKLSASLKQNELLKFLEQFHATEVCRDVKLNIAYPKDRELESLLVTIEADGERAKALKYEFENGWIQERGWSEKFMKIKEGERK